MMKIRFDLYTIQRHQRAQQNKNLYSLVFETVAHLALATHHHSIHKKLAARLKARATQRLPPLLTGARRSAA